ncbi:MAG: aspartate aminotransferase family protein [Bacteroidetes bacterium]|nr:aspartate aminotransferase family protein [Bacteroidota bacterium]
MKYEQRAIPGPKSAKLLELAKQYEPPSMGDQVPVVWDHGEGVWVYDVDGNKYLDFTSGVLVTNIGHSHPFHVEAIRHQAGRLMNCYSFPTQERIELSKQLAEKLPENLDRVFLLTTGAEATEAAIRIAKRYSGKHEILSFYGAFHGRTYGPMSVAGNANTRRKFGPALSGGVIAPFANCYRCVYDKKFPECDFYCLKMLDRVVESTSSGDLGAVITEPYQGGAGFINPPEGWLKELEKWAINRGLLLIVDEVQSAFGRTGKMFAIDRENVKPQMICIGKGIGSGMPTSALVGESKIFDCMKPGEMSSTTGGNPLSSAAALAVLKIMEEEKLADNAESMGEYLHQRLLKLKEKYEFVGDVRGIGLARGIEIVKSKESKTPEPDLTLKIIRTAASYGLMLGRVGLYGNVIRVAPPLIITEEEAGFGVDILDKAMSQF